MKQFAITVAAVALLATLATAQPQYGSAQPGPPARQSAPAPSQPSAPAPQAGEAQPAPQAPAGPKQPQAKSQEEYTAFMAAVQKQTPNEAEDAAREFELKYPKSELLGLLYQQVMSKYQQADNADKTVEMGRRAIQFDPNNVAALVMTGTVIAERTRESDIDRDERLNEAVNDVKKALQLVQENRISLPANATPEQVQGFKNTVTYMAWAALGQAELVKKNDASAEQDFRKALEPPQGQTDALTWLRLSLALDHQNKYADALKAADKAVELSGNNAAVGNLAKIEQSRLRQLTSGNASATPKPAAAPNQPQPEIAPPK
jgi:tetratricopeptide (TPR) repeat protein